MEVPLAANMSSIIAAVSALMYTTGAPALFWTSERTMSNPAWTTFSGDLPTVSSVSIWDDDDGDYFCIIAWGDRPYLVWNIADERLLQTESFRIELDHHSDNPPRNNFISHIVKYDHEYQDWVELAYIVMVVVVRRTFQCRNEKPEEEIHIHSCRIG